MQVNSVGEFNCLDNFVKKFSYAARGYKLHTICSAEKSFVDNNFEILCFRIIQLSILMIAQA